MAGWLRRGYGLARSALIYYGNPLARRRALRHYAGFVRPGGLCFDVGAHLGDRTGVFARLGARVVAVEPQPDCMAVLRGLYGRNPAVTLVQAAVAAAPGQGRLLVSARTPTVSTLSARWAARMAAAPGFAGVAWDGTAAVEVTTLDRLIREHGLPDFCKLDVEGSEPEALAGLSQPIPCLSFEYLPAARDLALACVERLAALGPYRFNVSVGETKRLLFADWHGRGATLDWLRALAPEDRSGDVYARLGGPGRGAGR